MKYQPTKETKYLDGVLVRRIQALKDFGDVKKGDLGGWLEKEANLSQEGDCWVYDNSVIKDSVTVEGTVVVKDNASVGGNGVISGNVVILGNGASWLRRGR